MQTYTDGTGQGPYTINLTPHMVKEFVRAAHALYARGATEAGSLLSGCAAKVVLPIQQYDRASTVYRMWLVFDEPKS